MTAVEIVRGLMGVVGSKDSYRCPQCDLVHDEGYVWESGMCQECSTLKRDLVAGKFVPQSALDLALQQAREHDAKRGDGDVARDTD